MANRPPQPKFVPEATDILPQIMVTPGGVEMPSTATQKSSRIFKEPARAPEKRKKETSKEEDPLIGKSVTKKIATQSASKATTIESMPLRQKTIKQEQEKQIYTRRKEKERIEEEKKEKERRKKELEEEARIAEQETQEEILTSLKTTRKMKHHTEKIPTPSAADTTKIGRAHV